MPHPYLVFCPYLPLPLNDRPIVLADWELAPLEFFKDRWADPRFKSRATTFLRKFDTRSFDGAMENPALLCRKGMELDGQRPSRKELRALELSLAFGFLDGNPRDNRRDSAWHTVTTDNADLHTWPIDLKHGRVTLNKGCLVREWRHGYTIDDPSLVVTPPIDLHMPNAAPSPDPLVLSGIYETVLCSLRSPGVERDADAIRIAVDWFSKAWRNTETVHYPERLVFLKTAFEAVTGESKSIETAKKILSLFHELPDPIDDDSEILVWTPEEKPIRRTWAHESKCFDKKLTDFETWFMAFNDVRNAIIHEGNVSDLTYPNSNCAKPVTSRPIYHDDFFYTAERLLRGVIRVLLWKRGYEDAWRSHNIRDLRKCIEDAWGT